MNINATLLLQVVNFFIAYLLFRYIFLHTGYQQFQEKKAYQSSLEDTVAHDKQAIETVEQEQKDAWHTFRLWCKEHWPEWVSPLFFFRGVTAPIVSKKVDMAHKEQARDQLKDTILRVIRERYES